MTLELLLAEFDGLIQTPADVEKLNTTILDWALKGKLATQCNSDESASELLARILLERTENNSSRRITKKTKKLGPISNDEIPYELPRGWAWTRLGNIIQISSGKNLTSKKMVEEGGIPVYGGNGVTGFHDEYLVDKPTVVIGRVGFYCGSVHLTEAKAWITDNAFITFYSEQNIDRGFLIWLLRGTNLKENDNATAQPVISGGKIYPIVVGLPPLAEQKRIVARVDELLGQTAVLTQQLASVNEQRRGVHTAVLHQLTQATPKTAEGSAVSAAPTNLLFHNFDHLYVDAYTITELKQAILQWAVQGRLVPQCEDDESIQNLLVTAEKERQKLVKEKVIRKRKPIQSLKAVDSPFAIPEGWTFCRLGQCLELINGRAYSRNELLDAGTPIIRIQNLNGGESWYYSDLELPEDKYCDSGDLLFAWSGTFGPYIWNGERAIYHYHIWKIMLTPALDKRFAYHLLQFLVEKAKSESHGLMLLHITKSNMENLPVVIPPLAEQKRIVAKVDELFALCDQLAGQVTAAATSREQLLEAVLAQASY